jgi:hypothetical protein
MLDMIGRANILNSLDLMYVTHHIFFENAIKSLVVNEIVILSFHWQHDDIDMEYLVFNNNYSF